MSKTKTPPLSRNKKMEIGKYADNHPGTKMTELARFYECTYNQVVFALKQYRSGTLHRTKPRVKKKAIEAIITEKTAEELLVSQFHRALANLESDLNKPADERIALLEKLFNMRKTIQSINLANHIKKVDSDILSIIIKKFMPNASDDDVIAIYKEAMETWKIQ